MNRLEFWNRHSEVRKAYAEKLASVHFLGVVEGGENELSTEIAHLNKYGSPCTNACIAAQALCEPRNDDDKRDRKLAIAGCLLFLMSMLSPRAMLGWVVIAATFGSICGYWAFALGRKIRKHPVRFAARKDRAISSAHRNVTEADLPTSYSEMLIQDIKRQVGRLRKRLLGRSRDQKSNTSPEHSLLNLTMRIEAALQVTTRAITAIDRDEPTDGLVFVRQTLINLLQLYEQTCKNINNRFAAVLSGIENGPLGKFSALEMAAAEGLPINPEQLRRAAELAIIEYNKYSSEVSALEQQFNELVRARQRSIAGMNPRLHISHPPIVVGLRLFANEVSNMKICH